MRKKVSLLGSTGAIGKKTLEVIDCFKEELEIVALAAKSNIDLLEAQSKKFSPKVIAVFDDKAALALQKKLPHVPVLSGMQGLQEVASFASADFTMVAMSGSEALLPTLCAIEAKKQVGLANKEIMVAAGEWIVSLAKKKGALLLPVDSEQSALFQCLKGEPKSRVQRLVLSCSGGPFLHKTMNELSYVTKKEALLHPHFQIGPKAAIDSSTLMNKGLEMIVARSFFEIDSSSIEAVIHPEQRINSFVEFIDGTLLAQLSEPDMRLPIQFALTYPERKSNFLPPYDFFKNSPLTFSPPDPEKFRCLKLAIEAMHAKKSYPCFLNAANEVLVDRFLKEKISWIEIGQKLEKIISSHDPQNLLTLEAILEVDRLAREKASVA